MYQRQSLKDFKLISWEGFSLELLRMVPVCAKKALC